LDVRNNCVVSITPEPRPGATIFLDRVLSFVVAVLVVALARKAWLDLDVAWDSFAYHMPFMALRSGVVTGTQYHLSPYFRAMFDGFPSLPDYIQGLLWRLTSRPQAGNFIGLIGLLSLAATVKSIFRIPLTYSLIAFLSIPIVLIQSTSSYVDLFGNSMVAILLLLSFAAWMSPATLSAGRLLSMGTAFAVALNTKTLYIPAVGAAAVSTGVLILLQRNRRLHKLTGQWRRATLWKRSAGSTALALLLAAGCANYVKDWVRYGNPVYPVALNIGPIHFPGMVKENEEPFYLSRTPHSVRWLLSVLEYKAFEGRNPLWVNSQGNVPESSPASRMGGFFAPFVLFNVLWFVLLQYKAREQIGLIPTYSMAGLTIMTSALPASQESRYYMYWLLCLVSINLWLILTVLSGAERRQAKLLFIGTVLSCLVFVLSATGCSYIQRAGHSVRELRRVWGVDERLAQMHLHEDEAVCVLGKNQTSFMYAPVFHPELARKTHYRIIEAYVPADCMGAPVVP
jgi:hypothetical protein